MASETDICNLALARFGEKRIMSLSETSEAAKVCAIFYDQTRDEILRAHRWNFAMKRAVLSQIVTAPIFGYDYAYQLPTDYIRFGALNDGDLLERAEFVIEGDQLLSDVETANFRYVWRITDSQQFDALFIDALSTKLAAKIAPSLSGDWKLGEKFMAEYQSLSLGIARRVDAAGDNSKQSRQSRSINSKMARARLNGPLG
tara:strand:+ start:11426 stop:12028 length:603 start_codon:yes stop_codon:yes gene_type:complete